MAKPGTNRRPTPEVPGEEITPVATEGTEVEHEPETDGDEPEPEPTPVAPRAVARKAAAAPASRELPDQDDVDPSKIPYGRTVQTKQGLVCSTQDPPLAQRLQQR